MPVALDEIRRANVEIRPHVPRSRLLLAESLTRDGCAAYLKLESELPTGSFKIRGALYALKRALAEQSVSEVVASSTGNHGVGVAYAASLLKTRATIFLPEHANPLKRERIQRLGAVVRESGKSISDACLAAAAYAQKTGAFFLNDATDSVLPAGPGTIALEILEELPETRVVYVPVGDTALIRGIASALKQLRPQVRTIGVQAERAPAYFRSWQRRLVVSTETCETIGDGLASWTPESQNVSEITQLVDDFELVSEKAMLDAIARLLIHEHVIAEPAGAASTAAWLAEKKVQGPAVLIVSGSNVSEAVLRSAVLGLA
jgi:threonine dehydratase